MLKQLLNSLQNYFLKYWKHGSKLIYENSNLNSSKLVHYL